MRTCAHGFAGVALALHLAHSGLPAPLAGLVRGAPPLRPAAVPGRGVVRADKRRAGGWPLAGRGGAAPRGPRRPPAGAAPLAPHRPGALGPIRTRLAGRRLRRPESHLVLLPPPLRGGP